MITDKSAAVTERLFTPTLSEAEIELLMSELYLLEDCHWRLTEQAAAEDRVEQTHARVQSAKRCVTLAEN